MKAGVILPYLHIVDRNEYRLGAFNGHCMFFYWIVIEVIAPDD